MQAALLCASLSTVASLNDDSDLIAKTTAFFGPAGGSGYWAPFNRTVYSDDYVFRGPIIGPFNVTDEEALLDAAGPYQAFPDLDAGVRSCWMDPNIERMVYCVLYPTGQQTRDWNSPAGVIKASNRTIDSSGEIWGVMWDADGLVKHQTVGAPINHHRGNGCGFGATFALVCACRGSTEEVYDALVASYIAEWTLGVPKERSDVIPEWWDAFCTGPTCP